MSHQPEILSGKDEVLLLLESCYSCEKQQPFLLGDWKACLLCCITEDKNHALESSSVSAPKAGPLV